MDTKKILKDGFAKKQVAILIQKDRNGKEHLIVFEDPDSAKEYKTGEEMRLATMYIKED